jgi:hypothetical protein
LELRYLLNFSSNSNESKTIFFLALSTVIFIIVQYFELTANCSVIRGENSLWKICVKKFRYLYDEASDLRASEVGGESPEVLDLEFLQYAKNDISPLLNQLQSKQKDSENKGMKGTANGETNEVFSHVNSARKEDAKTIFDDGVIVPIDKEAKSDSKVRIPSDKGDQKDANNKVVDTNVTDFKTETNKKKVNANDQKMVEVDKEVKEADKEMKEADKEVKVADKELKEADKEVKERVKEEKMADKEVTDWVESRRNCSAQTQVAFAKTHKTGGTTVQNILFRFGEQRRLSFVLPKEKDLSHKLAERKRLPQKIRVD